MNTSNNIIGCLLPNKQICFSFPSCINELNKWLQDTYPDFYAAGDDELVRLFPLFPRDLYCLKSACTDILNSCHRCFVVSLAVMFDLINFYLELHCCYRLSF